MRLVLIRLLWNFEFELLVDSENWAEQKVWMMWEKGELKVRIRPAHVV